MDSRPEHQQSRRQMFRSSLRYAALGGLALLSGDLLLRGVGTPPRSRCNRTTSCDHCPLLSKCSFRPQAHGLQPVGLAGRERHETVSSRASR